MNAEFCLRVADAVEQLGTYTQSLFTRKMLRGGRRCSTPGCIAGHAAFLLDGYAAFWGGYPFRERAQEAMGLDDIQAQELFQPRPIGVGGSPSAGQAAEVIRYMVKTGEVDWGWVR